MTALPTKLPDRFQNDAYARTVSAYTICLGVERTLQEPEAVDKLEGELNVGTLDIVYIRILGYLLHFVPTERALRVVVAEICAAEFREDLLDVGKMYFNQYITPFRASKNEGRTPTPSTLASSPLFATIADTLRDTLEKPPNSQSTTKKHALFRDGYRCVVTGRYDLGAVLGIKELRDKLNADRRLKTDATQCAHVFRAELTNRDVDIGAHEATLWAVMARFGYAQLLGELNGSNVHRLENVMTVVPGFHLAFAQLKVWFVATNTENTYKLEATEPFILYDYPDHVTFTTPDPGTFPVPPGYGGECDARSGRGVCGDVGACYLCTMCDLNVLWAVGCGLCATSQLRCGFEQRVQV